MSIDQVGLTDSGQEKQIGEERRGEKNGKTEGGGEKLLLYYHHVLMNPKTVLGINF